MIELNELILTLLLSNLGITANIGHQSLVLIRIRLCLDVTNVEQNNRLYMKVAQSFRGN